MIYCMSDIHGELDRFKAMLDLINFSSDDTLYIIGDDDRSPSRRRGDPQNHQGHTEHVHATRQPRANVSGYPWPQQCVWKQTVMAERMVEVIHIESCSMYVRSLSEAGSYIS